MTAIFKRKGRRGVTLKYRDATGRERMRSFRTRAAAEEEALRLRRTPDPGRVVLLRDFAPHWLQRRRPFLRRGPWENYEWALRTHILPVFGDHRLEEIRRGAVKDFLTEKLNGGLAKTTVSTLRTAFVGCLEEAVEDGLLYSNPARVGMRLTMTRAAKATLVKAFTVDQLRLFLDTCGTAEPDWWLLFRLLALTGLRLGEALALKWETVDWRSSKVLVCRNWTRGQEEPTKTSRERTVDVARALLEDLKAWDLRTRAEALQRGAARSEWVFPSRQGRPFHHNYPERACKRVLKAALLPEHYTPHCLRHTYASIQLSRGKSPVYVQRQLGHATITMTTDLYGRWLPVGDPGAADELAALLSPYLVERGEKQGDAGELSKP